MRIMHMVNHCGKANGHVNVSVDIACTQAKGGHQVAYTCSTGDYIDLLREHHVEVFEVCEPHRGIRNYVRSHYMFLKAVLKFRPQVIHAHMAAQVVLLQAFRLIGYKTVTTVHNEFDRSVWIMGLASRIIAVSQAGAVAMVRRGFSREKIRVVINGVIGSPRLPAAPAIANIAHPSVVTVCGLHHRKGLVDLITSFQMVIESSPRAQLYILGEGPSEQEYRALAADLGLSDQVHFLGYLNDPRPYLRAADVFVLASHADPGPLVIAEARNAGCAIVATNVDGIPEMVDQGRSGILVEPRRPDLLSAAIGTILNNPEERERLSAMAKSGVERFTIDRVCADIDRIYAELV